MHGPLQEDVVQLKSLIFPEESSVVLHEASILVEQIQPGEVDAAMLERVFWDVAELFQGEYAGYRKSNTKFHDVQHTQAVFLAMARAIHGAFCAGVTVSARGIHIGLCAALFHDVGFIQRAHETKGTGAQYVIGHEERSVAFMRDYFEKHAMSAQDAHDCASLIRATELAKEVHGHDFATAELFLLGKLLSSCDLLAQMADRLYLEKLFYLYQEFKEAGISGYSTELTLLEGTRAFFYNRVYGKRLHKSDATSKYVRAHFSKRWSIDRNLYYEHLEKNLNYLQYVLVNHRHAYRNYFRRGGVLRSLASTPF